MYIRKKDRELLEKMEKQFKTPKDFDVYIEDIAKRNYSLILKSGNTHTCMYCNHSFKSKVLAEKNEECPKCKNVFIVKGKATQYYSQDFVVELLDEIDNRLIIRVFYVKYTYINGKYRHDYREYCRYFVDGEAFVNSCYKKGFYFETVNLYCDEDIWRPTYRYYYFYYPNGFVYPNNIKKLLTKREKYKYCMLWDLAKHTKDKYLDFAKLLKLVPENPSIELLIKLKLYNLAIEPELYNKKGNFEARFGVPRSYYQYMKKYNVSSRELKVLKMLNDKDIHTARTLLSMYSVEKLEDLSELTNIKNLLKYSKMNLGKVDIDLYIDYLENAKLLGFNLKDKKYLYPDNLQERHDFVVSKVKKNNSKILNKVVMQRYEELSNNIYNNNEYIVRPPKDKSDFLDEAKQQNNCVYTNYYEKHAKKKVDIYFMRRKSNPEKSVVTIEVRKNKIVQKRIKGNLLPNEEQNRFLNIWEQKVLGKVA